VTRRQRILGIIGTGLIGTSVGLAARRAGWYVAGYDLRRTTAEQARRRGALDAVVSRAFIYSRCDVIVLAVPLPATLAELTYLRVHPPQRADMILDVASVKVPVQRVGEGVAGFVGSHPLAGGTHGGPAAARADLFLGWPWAYVPTACAALNRKASRFLASLGARPVPLDAAAHDRILALTSHLPQVVAWLFAARLRTRISRRRITDLCGPVACELLRLTRSRASMWEPILDANRRHIARELRGLARSMQAAARKLEARGARAGR
jgi:prephenate dehydrogenase